jgi:hypothetical protein
MKPRALITLSKYFIVLKFLIQQQDQCDNGDYGKLCIVPNS